MPIERPPGDYKDIKDIKDIVRMTVKR